MNAEKVGEKVSGITFHYESSRTSAAVTITNADGSTKTRIGVELCLRGTAPDDALWAGLIHKIQEEGIRLYVPNDFKEELVAVFSKEVDDLEAQLAGVRTEAAALQARNDYLMRELQKYTSLFNRFQEQLKGEK